MDVVFCFNGLGNQMSQYAFYLKKKSINPNCRFIFDERSKNEHNGFELGKVFGITYKKSFIDVLLYCLFRLVTTKQLPLVTKPLAALLKIMGVRAYFEPTNYDYVEDFVSNPSKRGINFYWGGWHTEKYFFSIKDFLLDVFVFQIDKKDSQLKYLQEQIKGSNSVSIHIRRGDFLTGNALYVHGSICTKEYFIAAVNHIYTLVEQPHFFIFSDDLGEEFLWIRNFFSNAQYTIVDSNKSEHSWKDMCLISNCKFNINSNSTFSWWGAWLNNSANKVVVVPKYFIKDVETKDVYPEEWIKLAKY